MNLGGYWSRPSGNTEGYESAVAMLLERGADVETADMIGRTLLSRLVTRENVEMAEALLEDADGLGFVSSYK